MYSITSAALHLVGICQVSFWDLGCCSECHHRHHAMLRQRSKRVKMDNVSDGKRELVQGSWGMKGSLWTVYPRQNYKHHQSRPGLFFIIYGTQGICTESITHPQQVCAGNVWGFLKKQNKVLHSCNILGWWHITFYRCISLILLLKRDTDYLNTRR